MGWMSKAALANLSIADLYAILEMFRNLAPTDNELKESAHLSESARFDWEIRQTERADVEAVLRDKINNIRL